MPFSMAEMQKYSQSILQFYIKIPYKKNEKNRDSPSTNPRCLFT